MIRSFDKLPDCPSINVHSGIIMYDAPELEGYELTLLINRQAYRATFSGGQAWFHTGAGLGSNYTYRPLRLAKPVVI